MPTFILKREIVYEQIVEIEADSEDIAYDIASEWSDDDWGEEHFVYNDCVTVTPKTEQNEKH